MRGKKTVFMSGLLAFACLSLARAEGKALPLNPFGIDDPLIGRSAPDLEVSEWINGEGTALEDLRGKVIVLEFFQMWCPGCNRFSIPLMKEWTEAFAGEKDVVFISVHTVFEGHDLQGPSRLKGFVKKKKIEHLVGVDRHAGDDPVPVTMRRWRTGGTPAIAVVDKKGIVRFKYFGGFQPEPVYDLIRELLKEEA